MTYTFFIVVAVIAQSFNPFAELVILIGIPSEEGKAEMHPVTAEAKIKKYNLELCKPFCAYYTSIYFGLFF